MGMLKEFRDFAVKGNAIDMAVGLVIGAAFGDVVKSLVSDVIMPPIGLLLGKVDFTNFFVSLTGAHYDTLKVAKEAGAPTLNYGIFLNFVINFLIVAFAIFLVIKQINRLKKSPPPADPTTKVCQYCTTAIPVKATRCPCCTSQLS
jgi:large conductance mechanosensitive channel